MNNSLFFVFDLTNQHVIHTEILFSQFPGENFNNIFLNFDSTKFFFENNHDNFSANLHENFIV